MKHMTLRFEGYYDEWIPVDGTYGGSGLCPEQMKDVFPEIDWTGDSDVVLSISHRRDTGFRTVHLERHPNFSMASQAFYKGQPYYISIRITRWLVANGFNVGDTIYVKAEQVITV